MLRTRRAPTTPPLPSALMQTHEEFPCPPSRLVLRRNTLSRQRAHEKQGISMAGRTAQHRWQMLRCTRVLPDWQLPLTSEAGQYEVVHEKLVYKA